MNIDLEYCGHIGHFIYVLKKPDTTPDLNSKSTHGSKDFIKKSLVNLPYIFIILKFGQANRTSLDVIFRIFGVAFHLQNKRRFKFCLKNSTINQVSCVKQRTCLYL